MPDEDTGSVTSWVNDIKKGDRAAVDPLWRRYFDRMVHQARAYLRSTGPRSGAADEEDAALSAFDSFCAGTAAGRFPDLADRDGLWRLLMCITRRKILDQVTRRRRIKRGGDQVVEEGDGLDWVADREPSPEFVAMLAEEFCQRLARLSDDELRQIALWKMEGYTNEEITRRLGISLRTLARRLDEIREAWTIG